jgi:plastocyanin
VRAALLGFMLLATGPAWAAGDPTVTIDNFTFSPPTITVPAGSRIIWVNHDDIPHVVAGADGSFASPPLDTDEQFARSFAQPGTYAYFCAIHPHMTGTITVTPAGG